MATVIRSQKYKDAPPLTSSPFLSDFIQIFQEHEPLWNTKHPDYSKRNVREVCYDALVEKMQEVHPDATRDDVTKKINNLRCSFRKEYKKVLRSVETGELYTPKLWYYSRLLFLIGQDAPTQDSDLDNTVIEEPSEGLESDADPLEEQPIKPEQQPSEDEDPYSASTKRNHHPYKRKKQKVTSTQWTPPALQESHASIFGRHVAAKLTSVRDDQRIFLEKVINEAIFEAELGNLTRDSTITLHFDS